MIKENTIVKKDTTENWNKAKNFIPKDGEIIVYIDVGMKIGNGKSKVNDLPFIDQSKYFVDGTTLIIENNLEKEEDLNANS